MRHSQFYAAETTTLVDPAFSDLFRDETRKQASADAVPLSLTFTTSTFPCTTDAEQQNRTGPDSELPEFTSRDVRGVTSRHVTSRHVTSGHAHRERDASTCVPAERANRQNGPVKIIQGQCQHTHTHTHTHTTHTPEETPVGSFTPKNGFCSRLLKYSLFELSFYFWHQIAVK